MEKQKKERMKGKKRNREKGEKKSNRGKRNRQITRIEKG
jgi:hypothetical protein